MEMSNFYYLTLDLQYAIVNPSIVAKEPRRNIGSSGLFYTLG